MIITLNIDSSNIFNWIKNKKERKLRIANYLDLIANEAIILANTWETIVIELLSKKENDLDITNIHLGLINQSPLYDRAHLFSDAIIDTLGHTEEAIFFIDKLTNILNYRNITKANIEAEINKLNQHSFLLFLNQDNDNYKNFSLLDTVNAMHKEATALYVIAQKYRVKI